MADQQAQISPKTLSQPGNREALALWFQTMLSTVRDDVPDLSARQLTILLAIGTTRGPHTVRGLAELLHISKPAVSRALDSLSRFEMVQRVVDEKDRRSLFLLPTEKGVTYLALLSETIMSNLLEMQ